MFRRILKLTICILFFSFVASNAIAAEKTFNPRQDYKGEMFVSIVVNPGQFPCEPGSSAKIIWGPWQTEEVKLHQSKPRAIRFEKKKKDNVPLTVIVSSCEEARIDLGYGEPEQGKYLIEKPDWKKR